MAAKLSTNSYGKSDVRLTKVLRDGKLHHLLEFHVNIQLTGDFARSYTHGDNRLIIATDSMKNAVYVLAKEKQFNSAEAFALLLAEHFPQLYPQVHGTVATVHQKNWQRIDVDHQPHDHAFVSGGSDLRTAVATITRRDQPPTLTGGLSNLLVAKTSNSAFKDFVTDRYRTLPDTDDRIFGTAITATWEYQATAGNFEDVYNRIRRALLQVFATHMSNAVQETMYEMGKAALLIAPEIKNIHLRLPNKHRIPVNLKPFGLENNNEIFVWTDEPYGDITATVERD